jgi:hypothetical protein
MSMRLDGKRVGIDLVMGRKAMKCGLGMRLLRSALAAPAWQGARSPWWERFFGSFSLCEEVVGHNR